MPGKILHLEDFALGGFCLLIFAGGFCTGWQMNQEDFVRLLLLGLCVSWPEVFCVYFCGMILCVYYCWRILCVLWPGKFCAGRQTCGIHQKPLTYENRTIKSRISYEDKKRQQINY